MREECSIGEGSTISPGAVVGLMYDDDAQPAIIGEKATIRHGTIVYGDVEAGDRLYTGHGALIREQTTFGDDVLVGTKTVIDGYSDVGSNVSLQTGVYVPSYTKLGDRVFLGPQTVLTNDPYPVRKDADLVGPTIKDDASVGANATILPDVTIGERAMVAAGSVVVDDVPADTLALGNPAREKPLPPELEGGNDL